MRIGAAIGATLALLSACAPGAQKATTPQIEVVPASEASAAPSVRVTQAAGPRVINVTLPGRNVRATLVQVGQDGPVKTWETRDHVSLSYDRGVLVATRGLGFDLMGANAEATLAALQGRGKPVYQRRMRYLDGENHTTYITAGCSMKSYGAETLGGQQFFRHDEVCKTFQFEYTNIYWTGAGGAILRAREWVSPQIGALETRR